MPAADGMLDEKPLLEQIPVPPANVGPAAPFARYPTKIRSNTPTPNAASA